MREDGGVSVRLSASLMAGLLFAEAWSCTLGWIPRSGDGAAAVIRLSGILLPQLVGKHSAETKKNMGKIIREWFLVFFNANEYLSRPTTNEILSNLSNNVLIVVVQRKIVSKKNVIIGKVDKNLFQNNEDELVLEFTGCNQWLKVSKVSNFTNGYHIKIESDEVRMAN